MNEPQPSKAVEMIPPDNVYMMSKELGKDFFFNEEREIILLFLCTFFFGGGKE